MPKVFAGEPDASARGASIYQRYCALCHGADGTGHGRAARLHVPPPVDLTRSQVNDAYRELIIRKGSQAIGRSAGMPPWSDELTDAQIRDLIGYLRQLKR
jgi:mono/diheme cytochrome c family protein